MLKVISTSVLFGLLGGTLPACAEESRHSSNRTVTDDRQVYAKSHASSPASKHSSHNSHYGIKHANKHSNRPEYATSREPYSYQPTFSKNRHQYQDNYYPVTAYCHQNQYVQYAHPRDSRHYQSDFQSQSHLKRHHMLPKHLVYSRVPRRLENRLGYLPAHLMRVRVEDDIVVIHIKNRIVHEIIRGVF